MNHIALLFFDSRGNATAFNFPLENAFFEWRLIHQVGMLQLNESMMTSVFFEFSLTFQSTV